MPLLPRSIFQPIRGKFVRYTVGVAAFLIAFMIRMSADGLLPPGFPFVTFFPAVIVATFLGGRGPGILCAVLSGLAAWFWFIPPAHGLMLNAQTATAMLFYVAVVAVDIVLIDGLLRRQHELEANRQQLEQMADYQTLLFKELQHRVANNLSSVASMLRLQRRSIERDPASALALIDRANDRIELMGRVHRQLYDPLAQALPIAEQIERAVQQARDVASADRVVVNVRVDPITLEIGRLLTVVLLITELLTNSFKHAFPDGRAGEVAVRLERKDHATLRLTVADNGCGLTVDDRARKSQRGLGPAIIQGFVGQLDGAIEIRGDNGVTTVVEFPSDQ